MNSSCSNIGIGRKKRILIMFVLTGGFMVMELIVGYCGDSLALVTDSFHMMSDMAALAIALVTLTLSPKPWERSTFGWARAEVLGALINSVFLIALCFSILVEAVKRFFHPEPITEPRWIFSVGVCGLVINLIGLTMFKEHAHSHGISGHQHSHHGGKFQKSNPTADHFSEVVIEEKSKEKELNGSQLNMHGVFLHVLADTMASIAVIISAGVVWATEDIRNEDYPCWKYIDFIDPALSILICFIIFFSTWPLLHQASLILLQTLPPNTYAKVIQKQLEEIGGVINVHDLHVWQLTVTKNFASVHLKCRADAECDKVFKLANRIFTANEISSTTIQMELDDACVNNNEWSDPQGGGRNQ